MHIVKEFGISKVSGTLIENVPYKFTLRDPQSRLTEEKESFMTVDVDTCARHGIPLSLELIGRTLVCSLESFVLPFKDEKYMNWGAVGDDDILMESLRKKEEVFPLYFQLPPGKNSRVSYTFELKTHTGGRYSLVPCPFYHFFLELTDEEYEECKTLPPYTVFRASFSLKAVEVSELGEQGAS